MDYFPFFFDLKQKRCLIVGGGDIATRKARLIAKAGAIIDVVAPNIDSELHQIVEDSGGVCQHIEYNESLIEEHILVIAATDIYAINKRVSADCQARHIPINAVDSPELCSIITPAIVDRSPLLIAISSGGDSPVLARKVRTMMESLIPGAYGDLGKFAASLREKVKAAFPDIDTRRRFWESIIDGDIGEKVLAGNHQEARELAESRINKQTAEAAGEVYLVGAGPGDPDLLTFKALRLMQKADVVLYDRLVSQAILDMVRKDAEYIYVGKRRSEHTVPQDSINNMLLSYAQQGKRVLRLKGGDPFIFGRGAEEIELLAKNGIAFQVVPGITAASGCAAYAGIPLTHRDYSQSVRFITGHVKDGVLDFRWKEFVEDTQTLVFYMGLIGLPKICEQLLAHGKSPDTPAALIERGTQVDQRVHIGDLSTLADIVKRENVRPPTLLVIGGVVSLHKTLRWYKV